MAEAMASARASGLAFPPHDTPLPDAVLSEAHRNGAAV
jgi:hypothetical protein